MRAPSMCSARSCSRAHADDRQHATLRVHQPAELADGVLDPHQALAGVVGVAGVAQVAVEQLGFEHAAGARQHARLNARERRHPALLVHDHVRGSCTNISSPGRVCERAEIRLPIEPDGTYTAASLPSVAATSASSAITVGSSPQTSSPTSAAAIASSHLGRGPGDGVRAKVDRCARRAAYPVATRPPNR